MDDVRGDFLGPTHGTAPAAVIANKNITDPLRAVNISMRKWMGELSFQISYEMNTSVRFI